MVSFPEALCLLSPRATALGYGDGQSLQNVNTNILPDGAMCVVVDTHTLYILDHSAVPSGVTVAPISGPGLWVPQ